MTPWANYTKLMPMARWCQGDAGWPTKLKDLGREEPKELWLEGDVSLLKEKCVAVVGSRRITDYGRRSVSRLVRNLASQGAAVVSGLMYGTDQAAHREAMEAGGKTIAVVGWGIEDQCFSGFSLKMKREIIDRGGLVISEWKSQPGTRWTFPRRDRIMAALANEIYVIEAALNSGSLITARWGIKLKRPLWAVPGPIFSKVSEGTNQLIRQGQAKMWLPDADSNIKVEVSDIKNTEIYNLLQCEILSADEVARKLGKPIAEVGAQLSILELEGKVKERGGKYYLD